MRVAAGFVGTEWDSGCACWPRDAAVRVSGGPGGGRSGTCRACQMTSGMAITAVNVATASLAQGQVAGSRRCRRRAPLVRRAGMCRSR